MKVLSPDQIKFLNLYTNGRWILNKETGLVDITGNFVCINEVLNDLKGIHFGVIRGNFECSYNLLTSLSGVPNKVWGNFICNHNNLISLLGAPEIIDGDFDCRYNYLTDLVGHLK